MKLKEQFENAPKVYNQNLEVFIDYTSIADKFAIDFAEWCVKYTDKNKNVYGDIIHAKSKYDSTYTTKELLKMYKIENGL
jgi:hypothetical protein